MIAEALSNIGQSFTGDAVVTSIPPKEEYSNKGKAFQRVTLNDGTNVREDIRIYQGNGQLIPITMTGQKLNFTIKARKSFNNVYLNGFWNSSPQDQHAQPQQASQAAQQPLQQSNGEIQRIRSMALSYVKDICVAQIDAGIPDDKQVDFPKQTKEFTDYILTGNWPNPNEDSPF